MDQAPAEQAAPANPKFIGKGICIVCHGRGTEHHTHLFRADEDIPCKPCKSGGWVPVECDTAELAKRYDDAFEKRQEYLKHPDSPGITPQIAAALAIGL